MCANRSGWCETAAARNQCRGITPPLQASRIIAPPVQRSQSDAPPCGKHHRVFIAMFIPAGSSVPRPAPRASSVTTSIRHHRTHSARRAPRPPSHGSSPHPRRLDCRTPHVIYAPRSHVPFAKTRQNPRTRPNASDSMLHPNRPSGPAQSHMARFFGARALASAKRLPAADRPFNFDPLFAADSAESGTKLEVLGPFSSTSRHCGARHRPRAGRTCTGSSQGPRNHGKRQRETGYRRRTRRVADVGEVEEAGSGRRGVSAERDGDGGRGAGGEKRCESREGP